jgi:6-phosphogluconolactonase/glucosamine-6-phosphate isomerase/deaminase
VPHLPFRATPEQVVFQVEQFSDWLKPRLPIDLVVLGLGTDHICFLKPGTTYDPSGPLASRVELWDIIKKQKWIDESDMRCACIKDCADVICQVNDHLAPDFAITITLKLLMESAKEIWILVTGEHKAGTVKRLLFGNPDTNEYAVDYFDAIRDRVKVILDDGAGISTFV